MSASGPSLVLGADEVPGSRPRPRSRVRLPAGAGHVLEHLLLVYRRTWRSSVFNSFLSPVLFLGAMGIGLGTYVDRSGSGALGGVPYLAFLAPGLLAANAMQVAATESTFPIMAAIEWVRQYRAMLATPISVADIVLGQIFFFVFRLTLVSTIFVGAIVLVGGARSAGVVLAVPSAVLTGLAFAVPIAALSAALRGADKFNLLFRFGITPMFLFSGTFFPISQLPSLIQPIAWLTPLFHGVALTRDLALGAVDPVADGVHLVCLIALVIGGGLLFRWTLQRRLAR